MRGTVQTRRARLGDSRLAAGVRELSPDSWAMVTIAAIVLVANLPCLLDFVDPNPLGPRSLLTSAIAPGRLGGAPTIDPNNGYASQALGHLAALNLLHLHLPWWNPFEGTGMPLLGETQSAAFFPPTLLTAISNGQLYEHILLELVAGLATFQLLRRLEVGRWAATGAGVAFALNGTFAWLAHATVNPVAMAPLLLLGIEHAYGAAREGRRGGWWLLALAGALSLYAGFPEVTYIDALLVAGWVVWRAAGLPRRGIGRLAVKVVAGAAVAALLAAPMLVAMLDYLPHADVGVHRSGLLGGDHLGANALPQLVLPYVYGPIFGYDTPQLQLSSLWGVIGGYLTTSLILFAVVGIFSRGRRGLRILLVVFGLLAFARMYGEPPGLGKVIGVLPGMANVAFFRYATSALELTLIILAALGVDAVVRRPERRQILAGAGVAIALAIAAALGARSITTKLGSHYGARPYYAVTVAWGLLAIVVPAAVAAIIRNARLRAGLLAGTLALDALAMFVVPELSAPRAVTLDLGPVAYLRQHLGNQRFFTLGPVQPNYGSYFQISSLNLNDLPPKNFRDYVHTHLDQVVQPGLFVGNLGGGRSWLVASPEQELLRNLSGYRAAAVSYVLTAPGQSLPAAAFTLVARTSSAWIFRLGAAAPYLSATDGNCHVASAGRDAVGVYCPQPATLVRRETYFAGWSARVDGRKTAIRPYQNLFQAVTVPAGTHVVRFSYAPPGMGWAGGAFAAGWLVLLGAGLRHRRSRSTRTPPHTGAPAGPS